MANNSICLLETQADTAVWVNCFALQSGLQNIAESLARQQTCQSSLLSSRSRKWDKLSRALPHPGGLGTASGEDEASWLFHEILSTRQLLRNLRYHCRAKPKCSICLILQVSRHWLMALQSPLSLRYYRPVGRVTFWLSTGSWVGASAEWWDCWVVGL